MDQQKESNQKMKSFANINKLVNAELSRQNDTYSQTEIDNRIKSETRKRKFRAQTTKTIFEGENAKMDFTVNRNATVHEKKEITRHFQRMQIFLQFYKEKLMLTKKVQDSLSKHVVTMDALKKAKEGYTD